MAGIMHPWGDLVNQDRVTRAVPDQEQFHRQHADIAERLGDPGGDPAGFDGDALVAVDTGAVDADLDPVRALAAHAVAAAVRRAIA